MLAGWGMGFRIKDHKQDHDPRRFYSFTHAVHTSRRKGRIGSIRLSSESKTCSVAILLSSVSFPTVLPCGISFHKRFCIFSSDEQPQ